MTEKYGSEFNILLNVDKEKMLKDRFDEKLVELIIRNREQKIKVKAGYDGVYGEAQLGEKQAKLFWGFCQEEWRINFLKYVSFN